MKRKPVCYVLTRIENDKKLYRKLGQLGGWTENLDEARRYATKPAVTIGLQRLKNEPTEGIQIEEIPD